MKIDKGVYRREMSQWRRGLPLVLDGHVQGRVTVTVGMLKNFTRGGRSHGGTEYAAVQVRQICALHFRKSKFSDHWIVLNKIVNYLLRFL
jgi:hypothetical protein